MTRGELLQRITTDPDVCGARPCIRQTGIEVQLVLDSIADGQSPQDIIMHHPSLTIEDIRAAAAYASELMQKHST
jgi:uncharacterized protein (DUF433 family)